MSASVAIESPDFYNQVYAQPLTTSGTPPDGASSSDDSDPSSDGDAAAAAAANYGLSAYSREMYKHTKRQMEAAAKSSRRRTARRDGLNAHATLDTASSVESGGSV